MLYGLKTNLRESAEACVEALLSAMTVHLAPIHRPMKICDRGQNDALSYIKFNNLMLRNFEQSVESVFLESNF